MAIVIDANVCSIVFRKNSVYPELFKWLFFKDGKLGSGGLNYDELIKVTEVRKWLKLLDQIGKLKVVGKDNIEFELNLDKMQLCKSDDKHVIALMRAGRFRLICTDDKDLKGDVDNKRLLNKPRGKIYNEKSSNRLLREYGHLGN